MLLLAAAYSLNRLDTSFSKKQLVLVVGHMVAKVTPKRELGKEGSGHFIDPVVGSQVPEVLHVGPEITGWEGPVQQGYRFLVGILENNKNTAD